MPNWTHNYIHTDKETFLKLKELTNNAGSFDFNRLIPMPEPLDVTSGSTNDTDIYYYLSERLNLTHGKVKEKEESKLFDGCLSCIREQVEKAVKLGQMNDNNYNMGHTLLKNLQEYGAKTWYEWRTTNWGTKWNACGTGWDLYENTVSFDTAWREPMPIFEKMQELFPSSEFSILVSYEEGAESMFRTINGKIELIMDKDYDWDEDEWKTIYKNDSIDLSDFFFCRSEERDKIHMQKEYENYKLEWMLDHGFNLKDLVNILDEINKDVKDEGSEITPSACLDCIEHWNGFDGELWASYPEWLANEAENSL